MALDRNGKWKLAEIMEVRREEVNSEDEDEATKEESVLSYGGGQQTIQESPTKNSKAGVIEEKPTEMSLQKQQSGMLLSSQKSHHRVNRQYEYYVTYLGLERRNDRWVRDYLLKEDQEMIKKAEVVYEEIQDKEKLNEDDDHDTYTDNTIPLSDMTR